MNAIGLGFVTAMLLGREPIPDKLVVLTFDDSVQSHSSIVAPILRRHGFGATFFITEGFDFLTNKEDYLTWEEIAELHHSGFEIGNHTRDHLGITDANVDQLTEQLEAINQRCDSHGIPRPTSFAWPGNSISRKALKILAELGIRFARRGGAPEYSYDQGQGFAYEPGLDHPLWIPSAGDARPTWALEDFIAAVGQGRHGRIAVLQFHGVPDRAHPWVHTSRQQFESYMNYLADHDYKVIALRDLERFVDPAIKPGDVHGVIRDRQRCLATGNPRDNFRRPGSDDELRFWLDNMLVHHDFTLWEASAATGLSIPRLEDAVARFHLGDANRPSRSSADPLLILPYPGGRHPRRGFLEGALRPQRETKVSVFPRWPDGGYVVMDVPEALWIATKTDRELLYLGHTHVPTRWSKQGIALQALEWQRTAEGLKIERQLPNGILFGASVTPQEGGVDMELWIYNGTPQTLKGLQVQNCVLLAQAREFTSGTRSTHAPPFIACPNENRNRWILTAWQNCERTWGNDHCPCIHSDPCFDDCPPGETRRLRGWLSFYEGNDIESEIERLGERLRE